LFLCCEDEWIEYFTRFISSNFFGFGDTIVITPANFLQENINAKDWLNLKYYGMIYIKYLKNLDEKMENKLSNKH
jgi:hypothetical protein